MAEIGTIARPYAQAAFDVAKSEGNLAGWAVVLEAAANFAANEEVRIGTKSEDCEKSVGGLV